MTPSVDGSVRSGFEPVRDAFVENFMRRGELGGAMGYADAEVGSGYGYVTNRMGMNLHGDPRDAALRAALRACYGA